MTTTTPTCPACNHPLSYEQRGHQHIVWCSHGPCPSRNGDLGAAALTKEDAVKHLKEAIEAEMEGVRR